jgi:serine/threonine-protein kinase
VRIGPYELEREIGRGGMAVVFRARDARGLPVAIKLLTRKDPGPLRRFEREVRLQSALGEAAGFVPVLDTGVHEGSPFLALPLLEGGTLRDRLARGPLGPEKVRALGARLARALGAAHALGIVHRDVKPENVIFTVSGEPLLADLGLAKHFDDFAPGASRSVSLSKTGQLLGTASYMAPEQVADARNAGPAADVFALGAVLYECLAGVPAFPGESVLDVVARIERGSFTPLARLRGDVPRDLTGPIERALARDPRRRFADGVAFARALETRGTSRRLPLVTALAVLLAAGVAAAALHERRPELPVAPSPASPNTAELVRRALALVATRDVGARTAAAAAVAADPGSATAHAALSFALRAEHRYGEAEDEAAKATDLDARCALGWAARSWVTRGTPNLELAERAVALDQALAWAFLARARAKAEKASASGAFEDATHAVELEPRLADAWALRAAARFEQHDDQAAKADLAKTFELSSRIPLAYNVRASMRDAQEDGAGAVADVSRSLELEPSAATQALRAACEQDAGDNTAAIEDASRAIALEERSVVAWGTRAHARAELHDLDRALSDVTRAIELDPRGAGRYVTRARFRRDRGERREARDDLQRFRELAPTDSRGADVQRWLDENPPSPDPPEDPRTAAEIEAALAESMGRADLALAERLATRAIAIGPSIARSWEARAEVREHSGDHASAEADASQAIDLAPGWVFPWLERARIRGARGDLAGAIADDERAVALEPESGDHWAELAAVRGNANDRDGALAASARAVACVPPSASGWYSFGILLERAGNVPGARAAYERVLSLGPPEYLAVRARMWLDQHPR